jgi:Leucine-rich repeat (LRR) protein
LSRNPLTSLPVEIWQLKSLTELGLSGNQLTSLPVEIWQLLSLNRAGFELEPIDEPAGRKSGNLKA